MKIEYKKITVHPSRSKVKRDPYEVWAFLVGGTEGVFAFYDRPGLKGHVRVAAGDDGLWWELTTFASRWIPDIIGALAAYMGSSK